jgi:hypothetical protein
MEGLFDFQGSVSTVGDHLLNPDCASVYTTAAELYYAKQIGYASLPVCLTFLTWATWHVIAACQGISFRGRANLLDTTPKDKFVVSMCVLLYLLFPTLCKQAFSLFNCIQVEEGRFYLLAE